MKQKRPLFPAWKCLLIIVFTAAYGHFMSLGFIVIDPHSATPEQDFSTGIALLCFLPFLLSGLLYILFRHSWTFYMKPFLKSVTAAIAGLFSVAVLMVFEFVLAYRFIEVLPNCMIEYDAYNDKDLTGLPCFLFYFFAINLVTWTIYLIAKRNKLTYEFISFCNQKQSAQ